MVKKPGVGCEGRGDIGVRFDVSTSSTHRRLNELRGEAGKVLEPVERPGAGGRSRYRGSTALSGNDHDPVMITKRPDKAVVMMSLEDYEALQETAYLLRSPKNARRLLESIHELEHGGGQRLRPGSLK